MRIQTTIATFVTLAATSSLWGHDPGRFAYLDAPLAPYYVQARFPRLTTPQWIAQPGVDAAVVLAIDDMRDNTAKYETFLRPILDRLKQIDGRAAVSIMTNHVDPRDPQLQRWIEEGVSIEAHTVDHPCPCLAGGSLTKAKATYDRCVDLLSQIPDRRPVAFRMPCCDSQDTPSPRFWQTIFNQTTPAGNFLSADSSIFNIFTANDPQLPRRLVINDDGSERQRRYLPFPSFVNTVENYPYPYVIGRQCWQFPCAVPSDWQAQHVQGPNNPRTVEDLKAVLDATVIKQGVMTLVFHPHGWIRGQQMVELIDYAVTHYGRRVKFLTFREASRDLDRHLLDGHPLRDPRGRDNGVRLVDLNGDGYLDVVIGNEKVRITRLWRPDRRQWKATGFPSLVVAGGSTGGPRCGGTRMGLFNDGGRQPVLLTSNPQSNGAWRFDGSQWVADSRLLHGLRLGGKLLKFSLDRRDQGVRLHDLDGDGDDELIVGNPKQNAVFRWDRSRGQWHRLTFGLPPNVVIVNAQGRDAGFRWVDLNADGHDDIVFSNQQRYGIYLFQSIDEGWAIKLRAGRRGDAHEIPAIANHGENNGAWFHSKYLWVQNENTDQLPDGVARLSFDEMLQPIVDVGVTDEVPSRRCPIPIGGQHGLAEKPPCRLAVARRTD